MTRIMPTFSSLLCLAVAWIVLAEARGVGDIIASGFGLLVNNTVSNGSSSGMDASSGALNSTAIATGSFANTGADSCWSSWTEYWAYTQAIASPKHSAVTTIVSTATGYDSGFPGTTETIISTFTGTSVQDNGGFTISTRTTDSISTTVYTISARPGSSYSRTDTFTRITRLPYDGHSVRVPSCQLSGMVPQCQSQWEAYASFELLPSPTPPSHCDINEGIVTAMTFETQPPCASAYQTSLSSWRSQLSSVTKPPCSQASVGGELCSTIKDAYVHQQNSVFFPKVSFAPYFSNGYLGSFANITAGNFTKSWWWPTSSTLGVPGCTLGCGRCAVTGGTVQLLYWPEATRTGEEVELSGPVTISTLGTVLTSPTYYVSYKSVFASDGCSGIGPTLYSTIVPIPRTEQLSSVFGGTLPCVAHVQNAFTQEWTATASFNVTDLIESVPFSIYSSQPWCATYQFEHGCNKACPTTEAYKPIVVVPEVVLQSMDPAWASCYGDIRGVYDPPIALTQVGSVKAPQSTASVAAETAAIPATPASAPSQPAPETSAATVFPDNLPSSGTARNDFTQASQLAGPSRGSDGFVASLLGGDTHANDASASASSRVSQTGISEELPDNVPSTNDGINTVPQGPQLSKSRQDVGEIVASLLGSDRRQNDADAFVLSRVSQIIGHLETSLPSAADTNIESQGSQPTEWRQDIGGIDPSVLDDAGHSRKGNVLSSTSDVVSQTSAAIVPAGESPWGSSAGKDLPQVSQSSGSGPGQAVGGIVAGILGSAAKPKEVEESSSNRMSLDLPTNQWDLEPAPTSDSETWSHHHSAVMLENGGATQEPTMDETGRQPGQASITLGSAFTPDETHDPSMSASSLETASATTPTKKTDGIKPVSTQRSPGSAQAGAESTDSSATIASTAMVSSSSDERTTCYTKLMLFISSLIVSQML